ncbi:MAG: UDP-N-acetylmuramoyl-L-alanine--D-glutamate ligase [Planctomycetota bacterium]
MPNPMTGKRVALLGLGRFGGGLGAARWLAEQGERVRVIDALSADDLADSIQALHGLIETGQVELRLSEPADPSDLLEGCGLLVVNPAVPPRHPLIAQATQVGLEQTSEIELLVERLPERSRVVGVTGTAGKSTTTAMIAHALSRLDPSATTHVGGNLGGSLLPKLRGMSADDWVVLELSSFMLERVREHGLAWSPHAAVLTNLAPNHLDWHGSLDAYRQAKQAIFTHQQADADDFAVLGPGLDDLATRPCVPRLDPGNTPWLSSGRHPNGHAHAGAADQAPLAVPGEHNRQNARMACVVVGRLLGLAPQQVWATLTDFSGLPDRLAFVAERQGVRYYNDSKSTTPEAALLAIDALTDAGLPPSHPGLHLILGGYDKGADLAALARIAAVRCAAVYTVGATGPTIADTVDRTPGRLSDAVRCAAIDDAVRHASAQARPGQSVCLSPGCASWDQFPNYRARGQAFVDAVHALPSDG